MTEITQADTRIVSMTVATFRAALHTERMEERAAIVAWLRKEQASTESLRDEMDRFTAGYHMTDEHASALEQSANAIEAGEHLK